MARLRDPERGCPWDREQDFATIAPYTIEETYEVADAIARGDMPALKDELGDLLFQVVFHARMAEETGLFDFDDSRRGDRRQDGAAPSACVRQCADRFGGGAERSLGATQSGRAAGSRRERTLSQALTLQYDKIVFILGAKRATQGGDRQAGHRGRLSRWPAGNPLPRRRTGVSDPLTKFARSRRPRSSRTNSSVPRLPSSARSSCGANLSVAVDHAGAISVTRVSQGRLSLSTSRAGRARSVVLHGSSY